MIREFTVSDFVSLIQKLRRFWLAKVRSNLKVVRDKANGYTATLDKPEDDVALKGGSVEIKTNELYQGLLDDNMSVATVIWRGGLRGYLNQANEVMKRLLTTVLHVNEIHPMIEPFVVADSLSEMTVRLEQCLNNTDNNLF